jgi:transmembrane sensor
MSDLPSPLRRVLDTRTTEGEILGVWRRVQDRRRARRRRRPLVLALVAAAAAVLVAFLVSRAGLRVPPDHALEGPLATVGALRQRALSGGDELAQPTELSDGSRVGIRSGARLSVLENSGRVFVVQLTRGHADFSVKPGGPRRWVIECGDATVEVVGTEFSLERSPGDLFVEVRHGVVLVRGDDVPDHVRRLTAGESLHLTHVGGLPAAGASATSPSPPPPSSGVEAPALAPSETAVAAVDPVSALYDQADQARRSGRPDEAARLLESAVARVPSGHHASLACFTLGRLYLEELGEPAAAATAFARSLAAGPPRGLEEDVRARLVEARARASDAAGARAAAAEYRARFPDGQRAADVNRWSPGE